MGKAKKARENEIRKKLREESNKKEENIQKIMELEEKLKKMEEEKCKGAMIRIKAKYQVEREKWKNRNY